MQQNDKVVLVTGAGRRIGREISLYLHEKGCRLIVHYHHSEQDAKTLVNELNQHRPDSAVALKQNLREISEIPQFMAQCHQIWGQLDALINNASTFFPTSVESTTEHEWNELFDTNAKAPFFLAKAAVPFLKQSRGLIVNITDIHTEKPLKDYPIYCASKSALQMLTASLAKELAPEIRVNAIAPGAIAWPEGINTLPEHIKQKIIEQTLLKRHGDPIYIAKAAAYLLFDADFVTGQTIKVDGGRTLA